MIPRTWTPGWFGTDQAGLGATAIAFAAVGAAMLKRELIPGLIVLATTPLIWAVGQFATHAPRSGPRPGGCWW
jgi:hypothetical protein